jgi:hypothetical protein
MDTLATYSLCEVETNIPNLFIKKRVDRGLPHNLMTHDQYQSNVASQLDKSHQDLFPSITKPNQFPLIQ